MPLDRRVIEQMLADVGPEAFRRLGRLFEEETRAAVVALRHQLEARDWRELGRQAHSLKNACASFGLADLAQTAAAIEAAGDRASAEEARAGLGVLEQEVEADLSAFAGLVAQV